MLKISISSKTTEWEKIKARLQRGMDKELRIGFFSEDVYGEENNNLPVAAVAAWQDLGAPFEGAKHIPPRPFMRLGLKEILKSNVYTQKYKEAFLKTLSGTGTINTSYNGIAKSVVPDLQKTITEWVYPPNATFTVEQKGRDDPLVDTGKMRDSVKAKVEKTRTKGKAI